MSAGATAALWRAARVLPLGDVVPPPAGVLHTIRQLLGATTGSVARLPVVGAPVCRSFHPVSLQSAISHCKEP